MSTLEAGLPSETSRPRMWPHACGVQGNLMIGAGEDCPWCGAVEEEAPARQRGGSPRREMGEEPWWIEELRRHAGEGHTSLDTRRAAQVVVTHFNPAAAPPPDSAPASGETRVTEEMVEVACAAYYPNVWNAADVTENRREYIVGMMRAALEAALASIQPTPATGVDRAGVLEAAVKRAQVVLKSRSHYSSYTATVDSEELSNLRDCADIIRAL